MAQPLTPHDTTRSFQAGRDAFAAGVHRVPMDDMRVVTAVADLPMGTGAEAIMRAWLNGWDVANLTAPVEPVDLDTWGA